MKIVLTAILATIFITGCSYKETTTITTEENPSLNQIMIEDIYKKGTPSLVDKKTNSNSVISLKEIKNCPEQTIIEQKSQTINKNAYTKNITSTQDEKTKKIQYSKETGDLITDEILTVKLCKNKNQKIEVEAKYSTKDILK